MITYSMNPLNWKSSIFKSQFHRHEIHPSSQLPPALHHNLKRRIIERFKKIFFSQQSNPCNLKSEIKKLSQGSPEPIEHQITIYCIIHQVNTACPQITQQTVIEEVLEESGYYNFTSNRYHSYPWGTKNHPAK
ncbi:serine/threonine-protein kinase Nek10-like isoform X5 [Camelus ferus]|uniref:Serine/threonine-protein kinase Nek10-like isoform X5 n=1 Tax=Camelus ferus TaxID=419612 RepID=A0A8B8RAA4_CAMFR|nr:serine/threonine-protein kinase Nek10-like isoform X5 [Camelus ferus]